MKFGSLFLSLIFTEGRARTMVVVLRGRRCYISTAVEFSEGTRGLKLPLGEDKGNNIPNNISVYI
jgi:hypothetical protein